MFSLKNYLFAEITAFDILAFSVLFSWPLHYRQNTR